MNRLDLLKTLAPGFLPLIIFILADALWGTRVGLAVGVGTGLVEFAVTWLRDKRADGFVLLDTLLLVALGGISLALQNDIFFKLKPALIEGLFCVILALSGFTSLDLMLLMTKRYMKHMKLGAAQRQAMKKSSRQLFTLFSLHTALIVYAAFFLSKGAWAFISGGLFYLLFAAYLGIAWLHAWRQKRLWHTRHAGEEWLDLVDPQGRVTGRAPRSLCHQGPGMCHPVVHLHVLNSEDRLYLQKRPEDKEIQPGKWDTAVGGHVASGESIEAALQRETIEELGLGEVKVHLLARYVWETERETELVFMFVCRYDKPIIPNRAEVSAGKFWRIKKIRELAGTGVFTPNFDYEFGLLVESRLFKPATTD